MLGKKIFRGRALNVDKDVIWVARGLSFWGIDKIGQRVTPKFRVGSILERLIGIFRLSRQFLRTGIHHLLILENGGFLITLRKKALIMDSNGNVINVFSGYRGNKPGHKGICMTPDGTVFFGEYTVNLNNTNKTALYRSTDDGMNFEKIHEFAENEVRHIHFVQWDKFENCIWMGTGDKDFECKLLKSIDNGATWETVGEGSQLWRAIGIAITENAIYWGTDAGSVADTNYIIKMDRKTHEIEKIAEIQGPCHGISALKDGTVCLSTGIEGGQNEKDHFAHVWKSDKSGIFTETMKLEKDIFPLIVQYGVVRFSGGLEESDFMVFTAYALKNNGETVYIEKI